MNIGQLMRSMAGEPQPDQAKLLELRVGQIVRGVVLQMLEGQEALVQLNGMQVRAKLESPIPPGQSTLLQVQPDSAKGAIVLKPVDAPAAAITDESLRELAKQLGLPADRRWAQEMVRDLRRDAFPLTRETAQSMQQAAAARPADVPEAEWMQAAGAVLRRGLPVTEGAIAGLRQTMFGKPAGDLLETLRTQLTALGAGTGPAASDAADAKPPLPAAAARVLALLAAGEPLLRGGAAAPGGAAPGAVPAAAASGTGRGDAAPGMPPASAGGAAGGQASAGQAAASLSAQTLATTPGPGSASAPAAAPAPAPSLGGNWVQGLLKWLGVDHEKQLAIMTGSRQQTSDESGASEVSRQAQPEQGGGPFTAGRGGALMPDRAFGAAERFMLLQQADMPPVGGGTGELRQAAADTMKQALMTLAASADTPEALRETAQQLVQHITGQQLLLSPERNGALLSHMTMFIPFQGPDGQTTASVHIQSRRGRKGELDPSNCRLLFDLNMKQLGELLVDVQVVDKIVSLNLWNDHPMIGRLLEESRGELAAAFGKTGYQLLAAGAKPFPDTLRKGETGDAESAAAAGLSARLPDGQAYTSKPYRGVDYRA